MKFFGTNVGISALFILTLAFNACTANQRRSRRSPKKDEADTLLGGIEENPDEEVTGPGPRKIRKGELYLPEDYNKYEIPDESEALGLNPSPLEVKVHVRVREIGDLNELEEKISVVMDVRLWWRDWQIFRAQQDAINPERNGTNEFNFAVRRKRDEQNQRISEFGPPKNKKLDPSFLQKIWKPDLFMENLVETSHPEFIAKPIRMIYNEDGTLIFQTRLSVTLSCNMDFHFYPADSQECAFRIRSYSFESSEMDLKWGEPFPSVYATNRKNTNFEIQVTRDIEVMHNETSLEYDPLVDADITIGGVKLEKPPRRNETFDVLEFTIKARRKMSYHMIQTYLPSVFFIAITWICFFIPPTMVECRIGITMTTLLTLTAMFASVRESAPVVSYVKAIDVWMIACVMFVFLCLVEFALLIWFKLTKEEEDVSEGPGKGKDEFELRQKLQIDGGVIVKGHNGLGRRTSNSSGGGAALARRIETFLVPLYFLLFLIFQIFYWPWLMGSSGFFEWDIDPTFNKMDDGE